MWFHFFECLYLAIYLRRIFCSYILRSLDKTAIHKFLSATADIRLFPFLQKHWHKWLSTNNWALKMATIFTDIFQNMYDCSTRMILTSNVIFIETQNFSNPRKIICVACIFCIQHLRFFFFLTFKYISISF